MAYTTHVPGFPLEPRRTERLLVDGEYFWRDATTEGWQRTEPSSSPLVRADPLSGLAAEDVEYVGPDSSVGENLHLLRALDLTVAERALRAVAYETAAAIEIDADASSVEHYVDGAGSPVATIMRLRGITRQQGNASVWVDLEYSYADWGEPITIPRPVP